MHRTVLYAFGLSLVAWVLIIGGGYLVYLGLIAY